MAKSIASSVSALCLLLLTIGETVQHTEAIYLRFQYGGEWANVGDANLGWFIYSQAYNHFDANGGAYQQTAEAWTKHVRLNGNFYSTYLPGPDVRFQLTAQAEYGTAPSSKLNGWNFRDLLIHTMMDGVRKLTDPTGWSICVPHPSCSAFYNPNCLPRGDKCTDLHWGHKLPSILRVNVYNNDGSLRPEFYEIRLTNYGKASGGGCSKLLKSFGIVAGLIPQVGSIVSTIVGVNCVMQG